MRFEARATLVNYKCVSTIEFEQNEGGANKVDDIVFLLKTCRRDHVYYERLIETFMRFNSDGIVLYVVAPKDDLHIFKVNNTFVKTISENAKETNFNYLFHKFQSKNSNLSESFNSYFQTDYIFDTNFFSQKLETFSCVAFLSDGNKILKPQKINLIPYFKG